MLSRLCLQFITMGLKVTPTERDELLVTYAALILNDDGAPITADNINTLIKAAGASVEPYWPKLFGVSLLRCFPGPRAWLAQPHSCSLLPATASLLEGQNVSALLLAAGGGGGGGGGGAASGGAEEKKGDKKEEAKKEEVRCNSS